MSDKQTTPSEHNASPASSACGSSSTMMQAASLDGLVQVSIIILNQALDLVNSSLTKDSQLSHTSAYIPGSTIGKHLRHARDHFALLLDVVEDPNDGHIADPVRELCYDLRLRNTPMETSRAAARAALESCVARVRNVAVRVHRDAPLTLHALTPNMEAFRSTFGRELWFAALHAIHHWSMIRVIAGEMNIQLEDSFGIAPSTLVYHGSNTPLGRAKI